MTPTNAIDTNNDDQLEPLAENLLSSPTHDPLSSPFNTKTSGGIESPEPLITKQSCPEAGNDNFPNSSVVGTRHVLSSLCSSSLTNLPKRQADHHEYLDSLLDNLGNITTVPMPSASHARTTEAPKRHVKEAFEVPPFIHDSIFITVSTILVLFALGLYSILQPFAMQLLFQ
ncbi:hypothetical protein FPRO06_13831 [Fusarium proliferatum]|nr:hypothetical protein FPRO06_13831 [Fusarium proliferatum]